MKCKITLIVTALLTVLFFFFYPLHDSSWVGTWNVAKILKHSGQLDGFLIFGLFAYSLVVVSVLVSIVRIRMDARKEILACFGFQALLSALYPVWGLIRPDLSEIYFLNEEYIVILLLFAMAQMIQWIVLCNEK